MNDYYRNSPDQKKPRQRSFLGCLVLGCLSAFVIFILFCVVITYLLFRAHPSVQEEKYFNQETCGFFRFQLEAMRNKASRQLLKNVIQNMQPPSEQTEIQDVDLEGLWTALDMLLYKRHYLYFYKTEKESLDFLIIIDVKRFSWFFSALLEDPDATQIQKITPPKGVKAKCILLKKAKNPIYIGVTSRAVFITNSESRLKHSLLLLYSRIPPSQLSSEAEQLLPSDNPDEMINGFLFWDKQYTERFYNNTVEKYPEWQEGLYPLYDLLSQENIKGIRARIALSTSDVLNIKVGMQCSDQNRASALSQKLSPVFSALLTDTRGVEIRCLHENTMVTIDILIHGVEQWMMQKMQKLQE